MTDKELKEKILAEIENLEKEAPYENPAQELGYQFALEDVIDYINSLPEEPVSEDLEEAANKYADNADYVYADVSIEDFTVETFKAGANYVLEEIESIINNVSDEYPRFQQGTIIHGRLIKLLEQLKK